MLSRRDIGVSPCFTSSVTATTGVGTSLDVGGASVVAADVLAASHRFCNILITCFHNFNKMFAECNPGA